jgi:hypothetical protein
LGVGADKTDGKKKKQMVFDVDTEDSSEPSESKEKDSSEDESSVDEDDLFGGFSVEAEPKEKDVDPHSSSEHILKELAASADESSKQKLKQIKIVVDKQKEFLDHHKNIHKGSVTSKQEELLKIIEKSGILLVPVGYGLVPGNEKATSIECVVVKNLNKELILSGMFPMTPRNQIKPDSSIENAVLKGIVLGVLLGKKLQIRQEVNCTKYSRRTSGKIDRRILSDIACGTESIFFTNKYDKYDKLNVHISVDSSGSMHGDKWNKTMTMVVAICKAASMVDNLRVAVSFRTTIEQSGKRQNNLLPYVVLAYDSAKDKFSKVRSLFPYLHATGATPEGLVFEATLNQLMHHVAGEKYYFLTISDGEPCFTYFSENGNQIHYDNKVGAEHTRKQYNRIIQSGTEGLAYYIQSSSIGGDDNKECFKRMYGKDSKFIDINNVIQIAKTMNDLFLNKD